MQPQKKNEGGDDQLVFVLIWSNARMLGSEWHMVGLPLALWYTLSCLLLLCAQDLLSHFPEGDGRMTLTILFHQNDSR